MKILIVSRGVPTPENPLNGIFEMDQAKALAKLGHDVCFFAVDLRSIRRKRAFGISHQKIQNMNVHIISIPVGAIPLRAKMWIGQKALLVLYDRVFTHQDAPDIIHAHFYEQGCIASKLAEKEGIPLVITEHSSIMAKPVVPQKQLEIAVEGYSHARRIISVSHELEKKLKSHANIDCTTVYNIVDCDVFMKNPKQLHEGFRYVSVANLIPRKRINLLVSAFSAVHRHFPSTSLEIIGDGPERGSLEKQVSELGLDDSVFFRGRLTREDIAQSFAGSDCFVLPSERETFGVVYAEAMMAGLPVIANPCGGPEDFVTEKVGILNDLNDPNQLAAAMIEMYDTYSQYDASIIRDYAASHFAPKSIAKQLTDIYNAVIAEETHG